MSQPTLCPVPRFRAFDANGTPLAGGKIYSYASGSTTPKATYADQGGTLNTNPVILDANGECDLWLNGSYKLVLCDADDVQIYVTDNIDSTNGVQEVSDRFNGALLYMAGPISDRPAPDPLLGATNHGRLYISTDEHKTYRDNGSTWIEVFPFVEADKTRYIQMVIGDGANVPAVGSCGFLVVPECTVKGWYLFADASGSCVFDVHRMTYAGFPGTTSIAGTEKPTLTTAQKNSDTSLSSWTTALAKGDVLEVTLESVATIKRVTLVLEITLAGGK